MPLSDRDYFRGKHPSTCTCTKCVEKRLGRLKGKIKHSKFLRGIIRLCLNLAVLAGLGVLARYSYFLFVHHTMNALTGSIVLIVGIAIWVLLITLLRSRYKRAKPSFKLTTFSVIAILLIFTFAGIQPMSSYKDNLIEDWKVAQAERIAEREKKEAEQVAEAIAMTPMLIKEAPPKTEAASGPVVTQILKVEEAEREAFELINAVREKAGILPTEWDDELYKLSKKHTQEMADKGELFHTPMEAAHGENAWGGKGYYHYRYEEFAKVIVSSWMSSPLHKAWLLHAPIKESVVSIVMTPDGQYASWSFWIGSLERGPELIEKIAREWRSSGSDKPWIDWLISEGYLKY